MKVDYKKLKQGLGELTGYDFAAAEQQARILGDGTPEIVYSKTFHAVIAAKVLGVTIDDIKGLPIREYVAVTSNVSVFLVGTLTDQALQELSGKQQYAYLNMVMFIFGLINQ